MLCHGPNLKPPERPAITQRNEPPELVAVNASWDVVPGGPSTTPPPRTAAPDDARAEGGRAIRAADRRNGEIQRRTRTAAIRPPFERRRGEGLRPGKLAEIPAAAPQTRSVRRASRLN